MIDKNLIPHTINYCWFGGAELSPLAKKCIASWKKYCPDFEIVRWDESNYPIADKCQFVQDAYKSKKWAFVSDYARLDIIYQNGGIYLDTDVEIIASPNKLLKEINKGYFGWQETELVASGLGFAMEKENPIIKEMMHVYEISSFDVTNLASFTCPVINTRVLKVHGLVVDGSDQLINGIRILPPEYLCPINLSSGIRFFSENTISIHHFDGSWMNESERKRMKIYKGIKSIIPTFMTQKIRTTVRKILDSKNDNQ